MARIKTSIQLFLVLIFVGLVTISLRYSNPKQEHIRHVETRNEAINVVLIACGSNLTLFNLSTNFLKTAVLFTEKKVRFTIFANEQNTDHISKTIGSWPLEVKQKHIFEFRDATYPDEYKNWTNFSRPCASLRLFLPDLMPDADSVIYLDTDILAMTDLHSMWKEFDRFTPKQMLGVAQEREVWNKESFYNNKTFIKFPFIPPYGINAGVLLMNFTRMREFSFFKKIDLIVKQYRRMLMLFDQDLINILGYYNPDIIYKLDCGYNFLPYFCEPQLNCQSVKNEGPKLIHGIAGRFVGGVLSDSSFQEPFFELLYKTINEYDFTNSMRNLLFELEQSVKELPQTKCAKYADLFIKPLINLNID